MIELTLKQLVGLVLFSFSLGGIFGVLIPYLHYVLEQRELDKLNRESSGEG